MSVQAHPRKRHVSIERDGDDYVVRDSDLGVMMRGPNVNDLRRACHWLQWHIADVKVLAPYQTLLSRHSGRADKFIE